MVYGKAVGLKSISQPIYKNNPNIIYSSSGTISFWVKRSLLSNPYFELKSGDSTDRFIIRIDSFGNLKFLLYIDGVLHTEFSAGSVGSAWAHVCLKSNGSNYKVYINGIEKSITFQTGINDGFWIVNISSPRIILLYDDGLIIGSFFDEMVIYSRPLVYSEIIDLYKDGYGFYLDPSKNFPSTGIPISTNLEALWHFDEGTGVIAYDSGTKGNNLNLTISSWVDGIIQIPPTIKKSIIEIEDTNGNISSFIPDVGYRHDDNLNEINEAVLIFSGTGELKRSLIDINSKVYVYENNSLKFKGIIDDIETFEGGALNVHSSGYEIWLAKENGTYTNSPYTNTPSATIANDLISESSKFSSGTIETGQNIDFRIEISDSIWNGLSSLTKKVGQDIDIDYENNQINILDFKGQSTSKAILNSGIEIGDVEITKTFPLGNRIIVYGKGEGNSRITNEPTHGIDAASQALYGVITKVIQDRTVTSVSEANLLADAEVARFKDPIKIYEFDLLINLDVISGDVITINAPSHGIINEEVRVVQVSKGVKNKEDFTNIKVTNLNFSRLIKSREQIVAEIEKNSRNQDTYDIFEDEYANTSETTTIAGHTVNALCIGDCGVGGTQFMGESMYLFGSAFIDDEIHVPLAIIGGMCGLGSSWIDVFSNLDMFDYDIINVCNFESCNIDNSANIQSNTIYANSLRSYELTSLAEIYMNPPCNGVIIHDTSFSQTRWSLRVNDNLSVGGLKLAQVPYGENELIGYNAIESPEIFFSDYFSDNLEKGIKEIKLDKKFLETTTINEKHPIKVSITPTSPCKGLYALKYYDRVIIKEIDGGKSSATFDLIVSAKRKGYEDIRYDTAVFDEETECWYDKKVIEEEKPKMKERIIKVFKDCNEIIKNYNEETEEHKRASEIINKWKNKKWIMQ